MRGPMIRHRWVTMGDVRIVLATRALVSFLSASRAAALAIPDLAFAAFFIAAVTVPALGGASPWFVLGAVLLGLLVRVIDVESWALLVPGGIAGRVDRAFGPRASLAASAAILIERLLAAALACEVFGHYAGTTAFAVSGVRRFVRQATIADVSTAAALVLLGYLWIRARTGHLLSVRDRARHIWLASAVLVVLVAAVWVTGLARLGWPGVVLPSRPPGWPEGGPFSALRARRHRGRAAGGPRLRAARGGRRRCPLAGRRRAGAPPYRGLRRTAVIVGGFSLVVTAAATLLFTSLVPVAMQPAWAGRAAARPGGAAARSRLARHHRHAVADRHCRVRARASGALGVHQRRGRCLAALGARRAVERLSHGASVLRHAGAHRRSTAFAAARRGGRDSGRVEWLARAYAMALACGLVFHLSALTPAPPPACRHAGTRHDGECGPGGGAAPPLRRLRLDGGAAGRC